MPARQQRTNNARGTLPYRAVAAAPGLPWTVTSIVGAVITIGLTNPPSGVSLNGIPALLRSDTSALPVSATLTGSALTLTFAAPLGVGPTLTLAAKDPAVRGPQGQYLAADVYDTTGGSPPVPAVEADWSINSVVGNIAILDIIGGPFPAILVGPGCFSAATGTNSSTSAGTDNTQITVSFAGALNSGDDITCAALGFTGGIAGTAVPKAQSLLVP